MENSSIIIQEVVNELLNNNRIAAQTILKSKYPFNPHKIHPRKCNDKQKIAIFMRDSFTDRYSNEHLINPGLLKLLSNYFPEEFPFQAHWKMTECHLAYWTLSPTIDHIIPIACGGIDNSSNWATTSMLHNSIKSNWTLEQLQWQLYPPDSRSNWDGLTLDFIHLVERNKTLCNDLYIKRWFELSKLHF